MSKQSPSRTALFSGLGILLMAVSLILINYMSSEYYLRKDMTEDQLYTLSQGSRDILSQIKSPVWLKSSGGAKRKKNEMANGMADAYMNGCRRPQRDLVKSDHEPTRGSVTASNVSAINKAAPASVPDRPSTWL